MTAEAGTAEPSSDAEAGSTETVHTSITEDEALEARSSATEAERHEAAPTFAETMQPQAPGNGFGDLHQKLEDQREALARLREQVAALRSEYARIGQDLDAARGQSGVPTIVSSDPSVVNGWSGEGVTPPAAEQLSDQHEQAAPVLDVSQPAQTLEHEPEQPPQPEPEPPRKRGLLSWGRR
jgi:hypothetical protein